MKIAACTTAIAVLLLAPTVLAQENAAAALFESPVKVEANLTQLGEEVRCTLPIAGQSLFGASEIKGTSPNEFLVGELSGSFTVNRIDENCTLLGSWETAFTGSQMTGIVFDTTTQSTYWAADPDARMIREYDLFVGTPTGNEYLLPDVGLNAWAAGTIDSNQEGRISYWLEISEDMVHEVDLANGAVGCSFRNPEYQEGLGAFGNGLDDAVNPELNDAGLIMSTGHISEGQPVRVSQMDCDHDPYEESWNIQDPLSQAGEAFANDIVEYARTASFESEKNLLVVGSMTDTVFMLEQTADISDCQGIDSPASDVVYFNGSQGEPQGQPGEYTFTVQANAPFAASIVKPNGAGNGKYVVHLNAGRPRAETIRALPSNLGNACFPLLHAPLGFADPEAVYNNIGKESKIGANHYFGTPMPEPAKAPAFFHLDPDGDSVNLPAGSEWTVQGVVINPSATSPRGASVTNAIQVNFE